MRCWIERAKPECSSLFFQNHSSPQPSVVTLLHAPVHSSPNQAIGRAWRMGQQRPVVVKKFYVKGEGLGGQGWRGCFPPVCETAHMPSCPCAGTS